MFVAAGFEKKSYKSCGRNLSLSCGKHVCTLRAAHLQLAGISNFPASYLYDLVVVIFFSGKASNYVS
jgi:hypothetical protein